MSDPHKGRKIIKQLIDKGVKILCPESVEVGEDLLPERISGDRVVIHSGCRLYGSQTLIMEGTQLGG